MRKYIFLLAVFIISISVFSCADEDNQSGLYETETVEQADTTEEEVSDNTTEESSVGFWNAVLVIVITLGSAALIVYFFIALVPLKLWFQARLSRVKVSWFLLIEMKWKNVSQAKILNLLVKAKNAHLDLDPEDLCNHYLAGVDITVVVDTLIRAKNANISIPLNDMAMQYLAKVDVAAVIHALIMASNAKIDTSVTQLAEYYLAGVNVIDLIKAKIVSDNSEYDIPLTSLKEHYLAGGNLEKTIEAYISAKKASLPDFNFKDIAAIDLSNLDVVEAVTSAITPRVVETSGVRGVARDGVEITMKVKVTLRSNIKNIIGGVSEETVLARVNEGLATQIGMAKNHYDILENPFELADRVENANLQEQSAYEILSVDVSDLQVGNDIGAALKSTRAKAMAEEAKAELIMAEEKVQKAMAAAFLDGKITVKEYNDIKNKEADTLMRKSFALQSESMSKINDSDQETSSSSNSSD